MSHLSRFVVALMVLFTLTMVGSRELFMFAAFRDSAGLPGDRYHLWLAVSAAIGACLAAALMFHFFFRYEKSRSSRASSGPLFKDFGPIPSPIPTAPLSFDSIGWALANPWLGNSGQADDREPVNGSVAQTGRPASAQRAFARRSHQLMFKKWSQGRHD
ncbi:MAG TPA: hypothetical protein VN643_27365 [Pyrinomonadaceae bacterium]|nr:hypothetical protein [Pyrinomonadaceae bacterium]